MDDEQRFQLAANASRRIVAQCRGHAESSTAKLSARVNNAAASTPCGVDRDAALKGNHLLALRQRISHVESMCNALLSHLRGLELLTRHETFLPIPALPIVRSIAEVSASCSWVVAPDATADERAARAYAALFRSFEGAIMGSLEEEATRLRQVRDDLIRDLHAQGVRIVHRVDRNHEKTDQVSQVTVGRAHAKTDFKYSYRVTQQIPRVASMYSGLSGVSHGEQMYLATTWETPDTFARVIGFVAMWSVEAWSTAIHAWVGVEPAGFIYAPDRQNLIRSIPAAHLKEFGAAL